MSPIALIKKVFTAFKKKSAPPPKDVTAPFERGDNVVLVFGHSNAGKTVYFSVLYELLKGNEEFKLSPLNNETAANLIENYNLMRGRLLKIKDGRQVEVEGERKFPTMTSETRILKFGIDLSLRKGLEFYTVDYKGETLSIAEPGDLRRQFAKFFPYARAALFFLDASVLDTDVLLREQIAAYQTILHDLRECVPKRVPVGIVITKSDFLEGFSPANPVELIPSGAATYKGKRKESFIRGLARVNRQRLGEVWARTTERVSRTLGNLIDSVSAYNLDFQFFFVSATGGLSKRPTGEVEPPRELKPVGVAEPLMWAFRRITFNKRKAFWRSLAKWACALCIIWIALFCLINIYHQEKLYKELDWVSDKLQKNLRDPAYKGKLPQTVAESIASDYKSRYLDRFAVDEFWGAAPLIKAVKNRISAAQGLVSMEATEIEQKREEKEKAKVEPTGPGGKPWTEDARKAWGDSKASVAVLPSDQQLPELEKKRDELFARFPKDSLNPAFVKEVETFINKFKAAGAGIATAEFEIQLVIDNIPPKCKVLVSIGDKAQIEFANLTGKTPTVTQRVEGKGNETVKLVLRDHNTEKDYPDQIEKPAETLYKEPWQVKRLAFGRGESIGVKVVSVVKGTLPALPSIE